MFSKINPSDYTVYVDNREHTHYSVMLKNIEFLEYLDQDSLNIFPNCLFLP